MCETKMTTSYIYLLQEREFIKTKENVYKVGRTEKENYARFNHYPKGSVLLFQMICKNCRNIEEQTKRLLKEQFTHRKDLGNEYFEGNYKIMINIIYHLISNEADENNDSKFEENTIEDNLKNVSGDIDEEETYEEETYEVSSYEEWIKYGWGRGCKVDKVIITNKKKEEGYIKTRGQLWRQLYDPNNIDFEEKETLIGYIQHYQSEDFKDNSLKRNKLTKDLINSYDYATLDNINQNNYEKDSINISYNVDSILNDVINKCYVAKPNILELGYDEYIVHDEKGDNYIFNASNLSFTLINDELINNKILTEDKMGTRCLNVKNNINTDIVDDILSSFVPQDIKHEYKKLMYNILVKKVDNRIIFNDYDYGYLSIWLRDLLHLLSPNHVVSSWEYYKNKSDFKKAMKKHNYRCVFIYEDRIKYNSIKKQICDMCKLGFRNIIVLNRDKNNTTYDVNNVSKYLHKNEEKISKYIKQHQDPIYLPNLPIDVDHFDHIFYCNNMLLIEFLKWCCVN